ncbi:cupin domain-containing protein [Halalkalibacterium ligniniphilum]|uniref:cupin domain-containing protein n=1 Tax=Halalkalibacterium ligniniphilum TaxID=1134413 RepID=UPI0003479D4B|nr:cupin domain-containing protein [Halalkalibacterium ligniniphilum]
MEIVKVKDIVSEEHSGVTMKILFNGSGIQGRSTTFGTVSISPGSRVPFAGIGSHEQDEYGLVLKGTLVTMSGGVEQRISSGQATFIPRGEEHWAYNDGIEDCEIVWVLVER